MLKVDYTLITKKGVETRMDVPLDEIKKVDGSVMLVQGPSSMGKSTVMNMIAIGSFGETDESLSSSVRSNLRELTTSSYRDLKFNIELENNYCGIKLQMSKSSGKKDIKVVEVSDGKKTILSAETFRKKYNLIYDVPENPTKRLEQIRDTIKIDHKDALNAVNNFINYLKQIKNEVNKVPSKEDIKIKKTKMISEQKQLERYKLEFESLKTKKALINSAVICRKYLTLKDIVASLEQKIAVEKKKPISNKSNEQLRSEAMNVYMEQIRNVMIKSDTKELILKTKNQELIKLLKEAINFDFTTNYNNVRAYSKTITAMKKLIPDMSEDQDKIRWINDLLRILQKGDMDMSLGQIGTVRDLFDKLEEFKENNEIGASIDYSKIKKDLNEISINLLRLETSAEAIDRSVDRAPVATRNEAQITTWNTQKNSYQAELDNCIIELRKDGIIISEATRELHNYCMKLGISITADVDELESVKKEINSSYDTLNGNITKSDGLIRLYKEAIDRFENNELPKYYNDINYLSEIVDKSNMIRSQINESDARLLKVINHDTSEYAKNPERYDNIWAYIGSKLETVRDCGKEYKVKQVNLLSEEKGTIYTEDGIEIHIGAMGTGEGQLSYLRGLLSTGDNRKIIALFDEVGNMSNNLLLSLTEDFVKLEKEGKLMIAFMARPTSDIFEVKVYD